MIQNIKGRFHIELSHFHKISKDAKTLLFSYTIYLATWPLFGTFINTFLWRQSQDISSLMVYNLGNFIGLPLGFILNGLAIKKIHPKILYITGLITSAIAPLLVIFYSPQSLLHLASYGLIFGVSGGIFWANKNFITLEITKGQNRIYFNNLESIGDISINTIIPFVLGWFIALSHNLTGSSLGYQITVTLASLLLIISSIIISKVNFPKQLKTTIMPKNPSSSWKLNRLIQLIYWTLEGLAFFLPTTLIMMTSDNEGVVGSIDSLTALISAGAAYIIGRKSKAKNVPFLFTFGSFIYLIGTLGLVIDINIFTVVLYSIATSLAWNFRFTPYYSMLMDIMDKEKDDNYSLVVDNEIFFNTGRIFSVVILFSVISIASTNTAIRIVPISLAVVQFAAIPLIKKLITNKN